MLERSKVTAQWVVVSPITVGGDIPGIKFNNRNKTLHFICETFLFRFCSYPVSELFPGPGKEKVLTPFPYVFELKQQGDRPTGEPRNDMIVVGVVVCKWKVFYPFAT